MGSLKFFDRVIPLKYDFYKMLYEQAQLNSQGVEALYAWMNNDAKDISLIELVDRADAERQEMERQLIEAFTTPFDRQDIYSISVGMDRVVEYAKSTLISMQAFEVQPNHVILEMTAKLKEGTALFSQSIKDLQDSPRTIEAHIARMRKVHQDIEDLYRDGMRVEFKSNDPMGAFRKREIYHHIKDASSNLDYAVDILHRIVVRML